MVSRGDWTLCWCKKDWESFDGCGLWMAEISFLENLAEETDPARLEVLLLLMTMLVLGVATLCGCL